jgi:mono/diheme cytochrome c family protein
MLNIFTITKEQGGLVVDRMACPCHYGKETWVMRKSFAWVAAGLLLGAVLLTVQSATTAEFDQGKQLFNDKCAMCHGQDGTGNGPAAAAFSPAPKDFHSPSFWQGDVNQKITDTIENGHGPMPAIDLSPGKIKAVIAYMIQTFKPGN